MRGALLALCIAVFSAASPAYAQRYAIWLSRSPEQIVEIPLHTPPRNELDAHDLEAFETFFDNVTAGSPVSVDGVEIAEITRIIDNQGVPHPIFRGTSVAQISARLGGCEPSGYIYLPRQAGGPDRVYFGAIRTCAGTSVVALIGLSEHRPVLFYFYADGVPLLPTDFNGSIFDGMRAGEVRKGLYGWIPGFARPNPPPSHQVSAISEYLAGVGSGQVPQSSVQVVSLIQPLATAADMANAVTHCAREAPYAVVSNEARVNLICEGLLRWILLFRFDGQRLVEVRIEHAGVPATPRR